MAGVSVNPAQRGQFAAIALLRWRLFLNSLRTTRGRWELVFRIFIGFWFAVAGIGGAIGMGATAAYFTSTGNLHWIAALLWPVFLFWQLFPVMATAFTETVDTGHLLRFPLTYRSYFLVSIAYGSFDAATFLGSLWLGGLLIGVSIMRPDLFLWTVIVLLGFALLNVFLARMIFSWLERWLAQRRTREILGVVFFILVLAFNFIGPIMGNYAGRPSRRSKAEMQRIAEELSPLERLLPPGLAADAIAEVGRTHFAPALTSFSLLAIYAAGFAFLLHLRLRAQFRGENLSESVAPPSTSQVQRVRRGWEVPGTSPPVSAIFEKEMRYLSRSGPMLFTLIMPVFMLLIFRLGPWRSAAAGPAFGISSDFAFLAGSGYALLILTNLLYNNFGADGAGIQFFFASPVRLREVVKAKNLAHLAVFFLEMLMVFAAVTLMYRPPPPDVTVATLAGILFAVPLNLAAGNLLSLYSPKKVEYSIFGRQRASQATMFASFAVQIAVFGIGALVIFVGRLYHTLWLASLIFLLLACLALAIYSLVLNRIDRIALRRQEALFAELSRT